MVDELLRHLSVVDELLRVATEGIPCGTQVIRAGEGAVFNTSVINRDEGHFPEPDALRLDRSGQHHVAFGFEVHQRLGRAWRGCLSPLPEPYRVSEHREPDAAVISFSSSGPLLKAGTLLPL
ncbi:hypothetical protein ACIHCV_29195 [Streptomyces sp. NPDC051956]|uniref:hypothetical protein n=1 Tax=Streptomyces sp. NPDC051956 TaxID=3365677 RepID=UPI0037D684B2